MENRRPWQGTALAVFDIISTVILFLLALLLIFLQDFFINFISTVPGVISTSGTEIPEQSKLALTGMLSFLSSFGLVFGILILGLGVLAIFMTRGALKGQRWSPILTIIFAILGVIQGLSTFGKQELLGVAINAFAIYCGIVCVQHVYYKKKAK